MGPARVQLLDAIDGTRPRIEGRGAQPDPLVMRWPPYSELLYVYADAQHDITITDAIDGTRYQIHGRGGSG